MTTSDHVPYDLLVPPQRLGALLAGARLERGLTLHEASEQLGEPWTTVDLLEVETGRRPLLDPQIEQLAQIYGVDTTGLIPERSRLVIDLDDATMTSGDHVVDLGKGSVERREVLGRYLAMVYTMRDRRPGTAVPLRVEDLTLLQGLLDVPRRDLVVELERMMLDERAFVEPRMSRLVGRVLLPAVGVIVAATTAGLLLFVATDDGTVGASTGAPGESRPDAVPTEQDEVEIGRAVVQERMPDGSPGPVVPRD